MGLHATLFRETLRQGAFGLVVRPLALLASWLFNIIRITAQILLGNHVSPELAVNGFHSFAGWLLLTFLALGALYVAQSVPALRRGDHVGCQRESLRNDPVAALFVPFIAFMISGVIVQAFWEWPALGYPVRVAVVLGALFWVRRALLPQIRLSLDPIPIAISLVVGIGWVWFASRFQGDDMRLATLGRNAFVEWAILRTLGTTLLVPIVEEAFFGATFWRGSTPEAARPRPFLSPRPPHCSRCCMAGYSWQASLVCFLRSRSCGADGWPG